MRAAASGDGAAYDRLLRDVAATLRPVVRRELRRAGRPESDAEDIVQESLLAIHLKRHTWDAGRPVGPWIRAIVQHKTIDALRRRGRRTDVSIDDFADLISAEEPEVAPAADTARHLAALAPGQRAVLEAIAVEGLEIRDAATRLGMTRGAVRVALHRALKNLARKAMQ